MSVVADKKQPLAPEHLDGVGRCLDLLEEAQSLCNSAAQALCPVPGFADQWSALQKPYDAVKAAWYAVDDRIQQMRLRLERGKCPACGRKIDETAKRCGECDFEMPANP